MNKGGDQIAVLGLDVENCGGLKGFEVISMSAPRDFRRVRQAALSAMQAQDELSAAWREFDSQPGEAIVEEGDLELLHQLVFRKIYPVTAFPVLVRTSTNAGIRTLLSRYLGANVCPDRGFGGFVFDISTMLDDLVEVAGEVGLRQLLNHPNFNRAMLKDERFVEAACDALKIDKDVFHSWFDGN